MFWGTFIIRRIPQKQTEQVRKIQLAGHQNPIEIPTVKPPIDDEDDVQNPTAAGSNDPTIPLPTTTPHSFTPGQLEEDDGVYNAIQPRYYSLSI